MKQAVEVGKARSLCSKLLQDRIRLRRFEVLVFQNDDEHTVKMVLPGRGSAGNLAVRIDGRPHYAARKHRQDAYKSKRQLFWAGQYAPRCRLLIRTDRCSAFLQNSRDVCV